MPTVLRIGPYRFFFYACDRIEPIHVHVERETMRAKFWLQPVRIAWNRGFGSVEVNRLLRLVMQHRNRLLKEWDNAFND